MGAGGVWRETYKYGLCDNGGNDSESRDDEEVDEANNTEIPPDPYESELL
jgi:hypothetical protein